MSRSRKRPPEYEFPHNASKKTEKGTGCLGMVFVLLLISFCRAVNGSSTEKPIQPPVAPELKYHESDLCQDERLASPCLVERVKTAMLIESDIPQPMKITEIKTGVEFVPLMEDEAPRESFNQYNGIDYARMNMEPQPTALHLKSVSQEISLFLTEMDAQNYLKHLQEYYAEDAIRLAWHGEIASFPSLRTKSITYEGYLPRGRVYSYYIFFTQGNMVVSLNIRFDDPSPSYEKAAREAEQLRMEMTEQISLSAIEYAKEALK